ncbi:PD-(D/E)XK nuclease family protein [Falsigemmobacter faecalis]|uniref:Double-strand break repair protein AddB n=1 Tax=Falsigemmobacter faecalis TaxID=2488730 RepID=A0A3P3DVH4_9RHOB|nr:PD-(D/E)XK nuclease family protein [Falsigemmobacter faecalis]RRH77984.1 double-strand break repair protein AddB [Falsigemmobacter faecalis]
MNPASEIRGVPPGLDFAEELVRGLRERMAGQPPEAMARVTLWVNSSGMRSRVRAQFTPPAILPKIRLVTDLAEAIPLPGLPPTEPPLRRRLQLTQLISKLLDAEPDLAPRASLYALADSLAGLMDEMAGEGVEPEALAAIDVSDHSLHWARTQRFLSIIAPFFGPDASPQTETRRHMVATRLADFWAKNPPPGPQIIAGTTGSRGATALLIKAVLSFPGNVLVMPGHDFDMPHALWDSLGDALTAEDHPQYRTRRLMEMLEVTPDQIRPWTETPPPAPERNQLVSLALRPAPVTDQWLEEGKDLPDLRLAAAQMTLIEASSPRAEALSVALILREAAEQGRSATLVSQDRDLARQVSAVLDRWGIVPDDSSGRPLALSAPGRLLRMTSGLFGRQMTGDQLLGLLKHPLVASTEARGPHMMLTRTLELHLRRKGPAHPDAAFLRKWASVQNAPDWGLWLGAAFDGIEEAGDVSLTEHLARHRRLTETLARGHLAEGTGRLWEGAAGEGAEAALASLEREAAHGGILSPGDYTALFDGVIAAQQVRETILAHPLIRIKGSREARELPSDLLILGALNDGSWPRLPPPDPWLNRYMRVAAGLLLPERRIGLSAHDFQQAVAGAEVIITRAARGAEAETVPSRWLNRLVNLMQGLPDKHGPEALAEMRAKGQVWLEMARALERPEAEVPRARRPAPVPPLAARPTTLPVTGIETLIRDPYAIYAREILRLRKLDPLRAEPDVRLRGTVLHKVMEVFAKRGGHRAEAGGWQTLMSAADEVLEAEVPWPAARALWRSRIARIADWFLAFEEAQAGEPVMLEKGGALLVPGTTFTLTARPDRIDRLEDGRVHIYDYKTGAPPSEKQQQYFNQQLLLQAMMAEDGGFPRLGPSEVAAATYVGLGSAPKASPVAVDSENLARAREGLKKLIESYSDPALGYSARRAMHKHAFGSDYDQLSRFGEWDMTEEPERLAVDHLPRPEETP